VVISSLTLGSEILTLDVDVGRLASASGAAAGRPAAKYNAHVVASRGRQTPVVHTHNGRIRDNKRRANSGAYSAVILQVYAM
jgi:hypothetical protein